MHYKCDHHTKLVLISLTINWIKFETEKEVKPAKTNRMNTKQQRVKKNKLIPGRKISYNPRILKL
jgi:hypothetical protein